MSTSHEYMADADGGELEVIVEYDFHPAEPDVNYGPVLEITRISTVDGKPVDAENWQIEQLELSIFDNIMRGGDDY